MLHGSAHSGDPEEPKARRQTTEGWMTGGGEMGSWRLTSAVPVPRDEKVPGLCDGRPRDPPRGTGDGGRRAKPQDEGTSAELTRLSRPFPGPKGNPPPRVAPRDAHPGTEGVKSSPGCHGTRHAAAGQEAPLRPVPSAGPPEARPGGSGQGALPRPSCPRPGGLTARLGGALGGRPLLHPGTAGPSEEPARRGARRPGRPPFACLLHRRCRDEATHSFTLSSSLLRRR